MKRDRLFGNALMRLVAYVAMAFVCAGSAWGKGINPAYKKWIQQSRFIKMNECMLDSSAADLDGNSSVISSAEKAVFTRIQTLNNDKELIHRVIQGDYTYRGMTLAQMKELQSISDAIKELTKNMNN